MNLSDTQTQLLTDVYEGDGSKKCIRGALYQNQFDDYWIARTRLLKEGYITKRRKLTDKGLKVYELYKSLEEL